MHNKFSVFCLLAVCSGTASILAMDSTLPTFSQAPVSSIPLPQISVEERMKGLMSQVNNLENQFKSVSNIPKDVSDLKLKIENIQRNLIELGQKVNPTHSDDGTIEINRVYTSSIVVRLDKNNKKVFLDQEIQSLREDIDKVLEKVKTHTNTINYIKTNSSREETVSEGRKSIHSSLDKKPELVSLKTPLKNQIFGYATAVLALSSGVQALRLAEPFVDTALMPLIAHFKSVPFIAPTMGLVQGIGGIISGVVGCGYVLPAIVVCFLAKGLYDHRIDKTIGWKKSLGNNLILAAQGVIPVLLTGAVLVAVGTVAAHKK